MFNVCFVTSCILSKDKWGHFTVDAYDTVKGVTKNTGSDWSGNPLSLQWVKNSGVTVSQFNR